MRDYSLYLKDIIDAMEAVEKFVEGMDFAAFQDNDLISSAVIRKFEIIGEASKKIPDDMRNKYPLIPWREMAGMRDRLIHFYFGIKYDLVWHTIKDILPKVKPLLKEIITETDNKY